MLINISLTSQNYTIKTNPMKKCAMRTIRVDKKYSYHTSTKYIVQYDGNCSVITFTYYTNVSTSILVLASVLVSYELAKSSNADINVLNAMCNIEQSRTCNSNFAMIDLQSPAEYYLLLFEHAQPKLLNKISTIHLNQSFVKRITCTIYIANKDTDL